MEAAVINKNQRESGPAIALPKIASPKKTTTARRVKKMEPGKSLAQIREEALRKLREMGLFF